MPHQQPNLLVFMVDQLTALALRPYGGTVCATPHIDALAARGVVFDNAYCPYPLCAPARFSMLAGRLPSRIGAFDNAAELPASTPTFAHYLRGLGYYTCLAGKMHFVGPDQHHGFEERLTAEIYPADFSWTPAASYSDSLSDDAGRHAAGVSTIDTVLDAGPLARTMQLDYDDEVVHRAVREIYGYARSNDERPFLLTVSLTHPHDPYVITREYWDRYTDEEIDSPRVGFVPLDARDPHSRSLYYHYGQDRTELTPEACRRARRGYYAMISYVDDALGRVIAALADAGVTDDTVILFTSDHGDMLGERGMWFKKTLFEPAVRVPLIIARPRRGAARVATPVSLADVLPTLVDLAGAPPGTVRTPLDGRSLVPALEGRPSPAPVFVEHLDGGTLAPRFMVRDGDLKMVCSRAYPTQLYDLGADPHERTDRAGDADYRDSEQRLTSLVAETWDADAIASAVVESQSARRVVDTALGRGRVEPWDFVPGPSRHSDRYVRRGDAFPGVERRGYLPYPER